MSSSNSSILPKSQIDLLCVFMPRPYKFQSFSDLPLCSVSAWLLVTGFFGCSSHSVSEYLDTETPEHTLRSVLCEQNWLICSIFCHCVRVELNTKEVSAILDLLFLPPILFQNLQQLFLIFHSRPSPCGPNLLLKNLTQKYLWKSDRFGSIVLGPGKTGLREDYSTERGREKCPCLVRVLVAVRKDLRLQCLLLHQPPTAMKRDRTAVSPSVDFSSCQGSSLSARAFIFLPRICLLPILIRFHLCETDVSCIPLMAE